MSPTTGPASTFPHAFAALRQIARALSTAEDLDTTLDLIARKTTEVMVVDSCTIYLLDPDGRWLRLRATTGLASRALGRATLKVGEGMTGYAVASNKPVFAADARRSPHFQRVAEAEEMGFSSLLAVPLVIESQPIGALNVQTLARHEFTPAEVEMLSLIGDLAAGMLTRAQLYDRQRRQLEDLQAVAAVSEAVTSPQYLDDILEVVTEMAARAMDAAVCTILLLDDAGKFLELHSAGRAGRPAAKRLPLGEGVIGQVAATAEPAYVADLSQLPASDQSAAGPNTAAGEAEPGLVSLLSVPLSVGDRVIGVLNCYTAARRQFTRQQQALFATLANQTALAIENARLITNAAIVREMHHRIKNNLQTVAMLMQLQMADAGRLDTRQVLETNIHRIRSIAAVHEVLSQQGFRHVDVKEVLERITRMTAETMTAPGQDIRIAVHGDPMPLPSRAATSLALVVNELVQNALQHAFAGRSHGRVDISLGRAPEELIILVRDDGRGLPVAYQSSLGLEIAQTLVADDLHGRLKFIRLESGTEVSLRLPRSVEEALE